MEKSIFFGNILIIICVVFYLIWWAVAFKPNAVSHNKKNGILLGIAAVVGVIGVIVVIKGIRYFSGEGELLPSEMVIWSGVAVYAALLIFTFLVFKRQVTTELLLIVGWAVLEIMVINTLYGYGLIMSVIAYIVITSIITVSVVNLICYILYYKMENNAAYVDGMIPLILTGIITAWITFLTFSV